MNNTNVASTLDLFSWSAAATRNSTASGIRYPSTDGTASFYGGTNGFNQGGGSCSAGGGDCGDMNALSLTPPTNYNANLSACPPAVNPQAAGDLLLMNILGWPLSHAGRIAAGL